VVNQSSVRHYEVRLKRWSVSFNLILKNLTEKILAHRNNVGTLLELDQHLLGLHSSGWVLQRIKGEQRLEEKNPGE